MILNRFSMLATIAAAILLVVNHPSMAVDFERSIETARQKDTANRPMVVSFGAPWCGWCRKMEADTFESTEVKGVADKFLWVKIDVDEEKELAARYQVEGLPRTIVLDVKGRMIGSAEGYMAPARFVKFLEDSLTKPLPDAYLVDELLQQLAAADGEEPTRKAVAAIVEVLSKPNRLARSEILAAMKRQKRPVHAVLLDLMSNERLAMRAAASGCLRHCLETELAFDAFADKEIREAQLSEWKRLVE